MAEFFDTHAHLTWPNFEGELPAIVGRAKDVGIERIVTIGTDLESSGRAIKISAEHSEVFAVAGWHPADALNAPDDIRAELRELGRQEKVVAIGETGLDYYRLPSANGGTPGDDVIMKARQADIFQQQLEVAAELGKNVVIHTRGDCFEDTLNFLRPFADQVRAVFHCFVGTPEQMRAVLELGSIVSFTGITTFKNAQDVRDTLAETPLDRLMLETDSPFLAPMPFRGKRCEPAYVAHTAAKVAEVKGCTLEELSAATCQLAHEFYGGLE